MASRSSSSTKQSAEHEFNTSLSEILTLIQNQSNTIKELTATNATILEILHSVHERSEDVSKKFDAILNVECGKPKVEKTQPKQKPATKSQQTKGKTKVDGNTNNINETNSEPTEHKENTKETPVITNCMKYFKTKYTEDPTYFNDILEENQAESVTAENADKLKNKKKGVAQSKEILSLIYKSLTKEQKKEIKTKMLDENKQTEVHEQELEVPNSNAGNDEDSD
jgi:hypothetical protein